MHSKRITRRAGGGELDLLRQIRAHAGRLGGRALRLGIGDDCALLGLRPGEELAVTTDLSIAGRHFRIDWHPPESVGHRALARGLSDLAAMGARPLAAFLSLGIPRQLTVKRGRNGSWVDRFMAGLFRLAAAHQTPLAGGDLAEAPLAVADIVLTGAVPAGKALLRSGARAGDLLYVTGALGGSAVGLTTLSRGPRGIQARRWTTPTGVPDAFRPHLFPQPRIAQGLALRRRGLASAAIDLSDGLSIDLAHLCEESGVHALIESRALPLAQGASLEQALHGGEDYELLFAARPAVRIPRAIGGIAVSRIGILSAPRRGKTPIQIVTESGTEPLPPRGWQHFS
jgi:thiamine-monophosphate kinase